jgi:hypothetical protein
VNGNGGRSTTYIFLNFSGPCYWRFDHFAHFMKVLKNVWQALLWGFGAKTNQPQASKDQWQSPHSSKMLVISRRTSYHTIRQLFSINMCPTRHTLVKTISTTPSSTTTVDPSEVDKFSKMSHDWWNVKGDMKPLHQMNPVRIKYIRFFIFILLLSYPFPSLLFFLSKINFTNSY